MKTYLLALGIFSSSFFIFGLASADSIGGPVYFMKTNSTAKLYTEFSFREVGDTSLKPEVYSFPTTGTPLNSFTIVADPSQLNPKSPQRNLDVTFTITAKNNITGTFGIFIGLPCTGIAWYPLVVGLNESKVDPTFITTYTITDRLLDARLLNTLSSR